jgi:hypothetical protein
MLNTKTLLIAIAILVLGGVVYVFSSGNIPVVGNQLTRAKAESMLWQTIEGNTVTRSVDYEDSVTLGSHFISPAGYSMYYDTSVVELEKEGLIKILGDYGTGSLKIVEFTDKAQPYLLPTSLRSGDQRVKDILLATPTKVEVTGITEPSETGGVKTMMADYTIYNDLTPFGKIMRNDLEKSPGRATFVLYDDGWRLR